MNNTPIFLEVLSNLNHDGTLYEKGEVVGADSIPPYVSLVADGVLRIVEGATSKEDAELIAEEERQIAKDADAGTSAPVEGPDTWGPTEPEVPAEAPAEAPETPVASTTPEAPVLKSFTVAAADGIQLEGADTVYALGEVVELDPASDQAVLLVTNGFITEVPAEDPAANL